MKLNEGSLQGIEENIKEANICAITVEEGLRISKDMESLFKEIITGNFQSLQIQKFMYRKFYSRHSNATQSTQHKDIMNCSNMTGKEHS
jgi:hypothetical protein